MPREDQTPEADTFMTTAEKEAIALIEAEEAAGGDPYGDKEQIVAESTEAKAARAQAELDRANGVNQPKEEGDDDGDADDAADTTTTTTTETPPLDEPGATTPPREPIDESALPDLNLPNGEPKPYTGKPIAELESRELEVEKEKATLMKQLIGGDLEPDEYSEKMAPLEKELRGITAQVATAQTLQAQEQGYMQSVTDAIVASAKTVGVDYKTDKKAARQFDSLLGEALGDPENASRWFKDLAAEAHRDVLRIRGITKAPPPNAVAATPAAPAPPGKPPARVAPPAPISLRNLPAANVSQTGGGIAESMSNLSGPEFEAAFDKLTPEQQKKVLGE